VLPVKGSEMGVFAQIMEGLAAQVPDNKTISIDATYPLTGNRCLQR
jgi:hypothetical protein